MGTDQESDSILSRRWLGLFQPRRAAKTQDPRPKTSAVFFPRRACLILSWAELLSARRGFRHDDLDKLAKFMTGTPIRGVVFIEAEALMRLVNESIGKRREFRLADVDQLLFGNKIIAE